MSRWSNLPLSAVCSRITDGTHQPPEFVGSGVPFLFVSNIVDGEIDFRTSKFISPETHQELTRRCPIEIGDVLYTIVGSYGNAAIVRDSRPFAFQRHIAHLKPQRDRLVPEYLLAALHSDPVRIQVDRVVRGVAQKTLNLAELKDVQVPLPPLAEQRRIAEVLDRAEGLRAKRRAALAQLESISQAIFVDLFGDSRSRMHSSRPLSECAEVVSGIAKGRKLADRRTVRASYLRVANVQAGFLDLTEIKMIDALESEVEELRLQPGDVVLTEGGDFDKLGRGAMWDGQVADCIHQNHVFRVRVNSSFLVPRFFHEYLQDVAARAYFLRCAKRTTNLASINMTQLRLLPVPLPPLALQREFGDYVAAVDKLKTAHRASLAEMNALFASLQHRAFRGEL